MKKSEIIKKYEDKIIETMIEYYEAIVRYNGRVEYALYIWEDGEIEVLEKTSGDNSWLQAKDWEERELFYVTTVKVDSSFNIWDGAGGISIPEDEDEAEKMEEELIENLVDEYKREQVYVDYCGALDTALLEEE